MYSSYEFEGFYNSYYNGEVSNHTEISEAHTNINANVFVRYTAKIGELSWFINGGGTLGISITTGSHYYHTNVMETTDINVSGQKDLIFGFAAGTGLQYRRLSLECRYQITEGPFTRSLISTGSLLLGFRLTGDKE